MLSLPLLAMAVLALGTYWMVRSTPVPVVVEPVKPVVHNPDYYMYAFSVKSYDTTGRLRTELMGDVARHYPDTKQLEIEGIRFLSHDKEGRITTATAKLGLSNQDSSEVQLLGNARIVREADALALPKPLLRMEYQGEFLHAFINTERVISHKPVTLLRGMDRISADSLDFNNVDQVVTMQGRVRATLQPGTP